MGSKSRRARNEARDIFRRATGLDDPTGDWRWRPLPPIVENDPKTVLNEADTLINGERKQQYGDAKESFGMIAEMWSGYLGVYLSHRDVVNLMVLLKVARAKNDYHRDSYVDICGYAALAEKLYEGVPEDV